MGVTCRYRHSPKNNKPKPTAKPVKLDDEGEQAVAPADSGAPKSWASLFASKKVSAVAAVASTKVESPRKKQQTAGATPSWDDEPAATAGAVPPPPAPAASSSGKPARPVYFSLFIKQVPATTTANDLKDLFGSYGKIGSVNVLEGKGHAFVDFYDEESVKNVLAALADGVQFSVHDQVLHVAERIAKDKASFTSGGRGGGRGRGNSTDYPAGGRGGGGRGGPFNPRPKDAAGRPNGTAPVGGRDNKSGGRGGRGATCAAFRAGKYLDVVELLTQLSSWEDRGRSSHDDKKGKDKNSSGGNGGPMKTRVQHNLALSQLLAGKTKFSDFESAVLHLLSEMQVSVSQMQQQSSDQSSVLGMKTRKDNKYWEDDQLLEFDGQANRPHGGSIFSGVNLSFQTLAMERDASLLRYNLALVYFRQKKYAAAASLLDVLLRAIEPMDENVAMHICFLYLDVILHSSRSSSVTEAAAPSSALRQKADALVSYLESPHMFNGLVPLPVSDKKPTKASVAAATAHDAHVVEFKFRLHLYKSKLALLHDNLKGAKKDVKTAMEIFQRDIKPVKGDGVAGVLAPIVGGIGSIYVPPSAAFQNSSALFLKAQLDSAQAEILYNNGLQLLVLKKYALAFRCLHAASKLMFNRPKLWLRLGECCTASYAAQNSLVSSVVGHGAHRRVVLPTRPPTEDVAATSAVDNMASLTSDVPTLSLPFAVKCFRNALLLSQQVLETTSKPREDTAELTPDSSGVSLEDSLELLRQKALVNLAYAYLSMNAPELAIHTAKELLSMPTCTPAHRFLVRSYYAEALCLLSRSAEASVHLKLNDMLSLADAYAREAKADTAAVHANLHVNNATVAILQKNMPQAEQSVAQAVRLAPTSRHSLELLVYILLRKGHSNKAMQILKEARVVT
ncbi:hypothetical protein DYB38_000338 [Aphanomyces astaci]|uniref:RRM domain-containing protein n=2 Tax=Aphanomyces astaci TaxID=112090 RepID=A0A397AE28_APHAT|nr:hypothetical protein DYB36_000612 [Aphanomyces astaci]RHY48646.1 hypothetical protein DYB38_000338 [Aphanomyces astaci]RHZ41793.1 hypothetical protein DYB31_000684 [Aphanomyces astaci]